MKVNRVEYSLLVEIVMDRLLLYATCAMMIMTVHHTPAHVAITQLEYVLPMRAVQKPLWVFVVETSNKDVMMMYG